MRIKKIAVLVNKQFSVFGSNIHRKNFAMNLKY